MNEEIHHARLSHSNDLAFPTSRAIVYDELQKIENKLLFIHKNL
jgi:hypothetical protein